MMMEVTLADNIKGNAKSFYKHIKGKRVIRERRLEGR